MSKLGCTFNHLSILMLQSEEGLFIFLNVFCISYLISVSCKVI